MFYSSLQNLPNIDGLFPLIKKIVGLLFVFHIVTVFQSVTCHRGPEAAPAQLLPKPVSSQLLNFHTCFLALQRSKTPSHSTQHPTLSIAQQFAEALISP